MVGGGEGAFIGAVHRLALRIDNLAEISAGSFSRHFSKTLAAGTQLRIPKERLYESYLEMAEAEGKREEGIDFVVIVTPNSSHFAIAKAFLENGIHVVCDKPLTTTAEEAEELMSLAEEKNLLFAVTYTYTGYPAVKHAKKIIADGLIGDIRFVNAEYPQEWLAEPVEKSGQNQQASWRTDPARSGISNCVGDIGSHIENLVSYVTGMKIKTVQARLDILVKDRLLDDNASIMIEYDSGAKGLYWSSQIAWGNDNNLSFRVFGSKGSVSWRQEDPNYLEIATADGPRQKVSRGRDQLADRPESLVRIPAGHPEGYLEAFANIYKTYCTALKKKLAGIEPDEQDLDFPTPADGLAGVKFIEACVASSKAGTVPITVE